MCGRQISADLAASEGEFIDGTPGVGQVKNENSTLSMQSAQRLDLSDIGPFDPHWDTPTHEPQVSRHLSLTMKCLG